MTAHKTAASMDPLTGMFNRRGFAEASARVIEREAGAGRPVTVLFFDIDHFKSINDRLGHPGGDHSLKLPPTVVINNPEHQRLSGRLRRRGIRGTVAGRAGSGAIAAQRLRPSFGGSGIDNEDRTGRHHRQHRRRRGAGRDRARVLLAARIRRSIRPSAAAAIASRRPRNCRCRWKTGGARPREWRARRSRRPLRASQGRAAVTLRLPFGRYHTGHEHTRSHSANATLMSLEAAAVSARGGFACMFSTSDEYETALILERRAQGRYAAPQALAAGDVRRLRPDGRRHRVAVQLSVPRNGGCRAPQGALLLCGRLR